MRGKSNEKELPHSFGPRALWSPGTGDFQLLLWTPPVS